MFKKYYCNYKDVEILILKFYSVKQTWILKTYQQKVVNKFSNKNTFQQNFYNSFLLTYYKQHVDKFKIKKTSIKKPLKFKSVII